MAAVADAHADSTETARQMNPPGAQFKSRPVSDGTGLQTIARRPAQTPVVEQVEPRRRSTWLRRYRRGLVAIDLITAFVALSISYLIRFGPTLAGHNTYAVLLILLPFAWVAVIAVNHGYEARFVGVGAAEFQRIFHSFLHLTALVSFASFVTHASLARGFVLVALPLALCLDGLGRYAARKWLHAQRAAGRAMKSVLIVGDAEAIKSFTTVLVRDRHAGMRVVGACVPSEVVAETHTVETLGSVDVPLLGDVDSVVSAVKYSGADTVAVVSSGRIGPEKLRWISWQLEGSATELVVSPGLIEVAGPRLHIQPVAGLPLLHVEEPELSGFRRVLKSGFDRGVAASALLVFSPIFISIVLAVRFTSQGPALFRQTRVGRDGRTFTMLKFRSMFTDAEERLAAIKNQNDHGDGVLFKMRDDPRVTRIGKLLRKFSLDELPQLINVVNGSMSLVGPRPPLPSEVARYEDHVHRRFLVKPGVTGLWQVSGRSNLAWDESVRLDLRYVENWSIAGDLQILWKTVFAVVRGTGAY
ncbi:MAG: sugar transferase [Actinomycetota bacterium]|nr:sugar transferase [Actinomycetota bacterium]MDQ2956746.1 sugar transferase [Actinomycetota bacterium]